MHSRSPHPIVELTAATPDGPNDEKGPEHIETNTVEGGGSQASRALSTAFPASTAAMKRNARIRFATLCWSMCLAGWNDGTTGPLLPRIQSVYHVGLSLDSGWTVDTTLLVG